MAIAIARNQSRLGRGLASLMGEPMAVSGRLPMDGEHRLVPIELIRESLLNPRKSFNETELDELADSLRQRGLVQPLIVRPNPREPGHFEIVAGERRWRAAQKAGLHTLPVIVRDLKDNEVLELAIIENVQRTDLNAIEEAKGYRDLIDRFGYQQDELATIIGKSRSHLANTLRLLKLPDAVQQLVHDGQLTAGHARALIGRDDAEALARMIIERGLNVRAVESLVQQDADGVPQRKRVRDKDADTRAFEDELTESVGLRVEVKRGPIGEAGILVVRYANYDQLEYLRKRLLGVPPDVN